MRCQRFVNGAMLTELCHVEKSGAIFCGTMMVSGAMLTGSKIDENYLTGFVSKSLQRFVSYCFALKAMYFFSLKWKKV